MHAKELLELERRDIRALHYTWIAFFLTFYVWFNMAPLATSMLQTESYLTPDHIKLFLIANVALTIPGMVLFITTGIGNGSTFTMIPVIFRTFHDRREPEKAGTEELFVEIRKESAAVVGFTSAVAAYGAFFVPKMFGSGLGIDGTFISLIIFYVLCIVLTWWYYSRPNAEIPC